MAQNYGVPGGLVVNIYQTKGNERGKIMKFTVDTNYSYREFESASVEVEADSADDITADDVIAALECRRGADFDGLSLIGWAVDGES